MKITLLIGSLTGGGAERVVCNLANFLVKKNHKVTILTVNDLKTYETDDRVRHVVLYRKTGSHLPHFIINLIRINRMNRYFRKEKMDVYLTFLPELTKLILLQKRFLRCPIILAQRSDPEVYYHASEHNRKSFEKYYSQADGYVFQTEDAKKFFEHRGINVLNSLVVANAVNQDFVSKSYKGTRRKVIVSAGRLTKAKNFSMLIEAFSQIQDKYSEYNLEIFGDGELKEKLIQQAESKGLKERVIFPGYVNNLGEKIKDASLFVLSSDYEGMSNALMEAMTLGLPVISTDCPAGGSRFLIEDGKNGRLVPVGDVEKMKEAIDDMLSDYGASIQMGVEARKICDELQSDKVYSKWEDFIKNTVNKID